MAARDGKFAAWYQFAVAATYIVLAIFFVPFLLFAAALGGGFGVLLVVLPVWVGLSWAHAVLAIDFRRRRGWESRRVRRAVWPLLLIEPVFMLYLIAILNGGWVLGPMSWIALVALAIGGSSIHALLHARRTRHEETD